MVGESELTFCAGTVRLKPVIRTTGQSRIQNSQISWSLGFFGPSFYEVADPELTSFTNGSLFDVVIIPEGGVENNTLASYVRAYRLLHSRDMLTLTLTQDSCFRDLLSDLAYIGDELLLFHYVPLYLSNATARINKFAPSGFEFNSNDTVCRSSSCISMSDRPITITALVCHAIDLRLRPRLSRKKRLLQPIHRGRVDGI